jgi:uncharacterized protein
MIALLALSSALAAEPPQPAKIALTHPAGAAGFWEGVVRRGSAQLAVRFEFRPGARPAGEFSAPSLGAVAIPLRNVRLAPALHADLVGDASTTAIDARVSGDVMRGSFDEPGEPAATLELHRVQAAQAMPYDIVPVRFADGGVRLSGSVYAPRSPGRHAAVVMLQGSGPEGRWASAYIADTLARAGVVALAYDKRGVGESTGDWRTATFEQLAADGRAALHVLAQRADVDRARVGVYGHSQGAMIAPAVAANDREVRWIAAADGPVGPVYHQDLFRVDTALAKHYSGAQLAAADRLYAEFVDVARAGATHDALRAHIARAGAAPWVKDLAIPPDDSWIWSWYAKTGNYDNSSAWASVRVPVLVLFGADDALVPVRSSVDATLRLLRAHDDSHVTVRVFPNADHTLRVPSADPHGWPHVAAGFPDILAAFAQRPSRFAR